MKTFEEPTTKHVKHDKASQCARILAHLKTHGRITNVQLNTMGIYRYSARVKDLRDEGHPILTRRVKDQLWEFIYKDIDLDEAEAAA